MIREVVRSLVATLLVVTVAAPLAFNAQVRADEWVVSADNATAEDFEEIEWENDILGELGISDPLGFSNPPSELQQFPLDHFKCYWVRDLKTFQPQTVVLVDQFGNETVKVVRTLQFCNPVQKNNETIRNINNHLTCYVIRGQDRFSSRPVNVYNQFGNETLLAVSPKTLCVPTQKLPLGAPSRLDHFKCYRVREITSFQARTVFLRDQFEKKMSVVIKPVFLCNPTSKDGSPVYDFQTHLVCYKISDAHGQPKFMPRTIDVFNQFGVQKLVVKRPATLCVPSIKAAG